MNTESLINRLSSAAVTGRAVDANFLGLLLISGIVVFLLIGLVVGFCVKYRRGSNAIRRGRAATNLRLEIIWTAIPLFVFLGLFVWSGTIYFQMARPPRDAEEIHVVAKQWMWKIQHPNGRREINELHLRVGQAVSLIMISQDVIHSFFVPAFRSKQDVLPGRYTRQWFLPDRPGRYHLFCAEYCGTDHSAMIGTVEVMEDAAYARWLALENPPLSQVAAGRKIFFSRGCSGCHTTGTQIPSPLLTGLYGNAVALADGTTIIADETYLRDAILLPNKQVVGGYEPVMPTFQGQLAEEEILQLIAYIKSLNPSDAAAP